MGVRPEYMLSANEDSPYYASMRSMSELMSRASDEVWQTEPLPDDWTLRRWSGWEGWTPRDSRPRVQGWKIHVSATPDDARETLARTTRICVARDVSFKFRHEAGALQDTNGKQHDRGSSGKFVTIYPDSDEQLAVLLEELEAALAGQRGPYILSDLRYRDAPVYVRYGAILSFSYPDANDRPVLAITDPDLRMIADQRQPKFHIPDGIELPACLQESWDRSRTSTPSRLREFKAVSPLHFSNAGGVYKATLPDDTQRVLREARSHTGLDARGRDAVQRQEEEEVILTDLRGVPGVQQLLGSFWAWEHRYLELEYAEGRALTSWVVLNSPFHGEAQDGGRSAYAERAMRIGRQMIETIERVHACGWAVGDLHPGNVLVSDDDEVTIIDFEDATRVGEERAIGFRVFEFCGPEVLDAVQSDWYAISRSLMLMYVPDWEIEAIAPDFWAEAMRRVEQQYGPEPVAQIASVLARFPDPGHHVLTPKETVHAWGDTSLDPQALIAGLDAGIEWSRQFSPKGAFPGDPTQGGDMTESFGFGRAGVVWARTRLGRPNDERDLDALEESLTVGDDPGLWTGRAGVALALAGAGREDAARRAAASALVESMGRQRLDLYGGRAGVVLAAIEVGRATGDEQLLADALAANDRLQRAASIEGPTRRDLTDRRGYLFGLTGLALADVVAHLATGDGARLERAASTLRAELDACITTAVGELMVRDVANNRALPYIEWGSAGIWGVALAVERLAARAVVTAEEYPKLVNACSSDIYVYSTLDHGRAGIMSILAAAGPAHAEEAERQRRLLLPNLLRRDDMVFTVGDGLIRLSSDVATGAAGIAIALHGLASGNVFGWLPVLDDTAARLSALPVPPRAEPLEPVLEALQGLLALV